MNRKYAKLMFKELLEVLGIGSLFLPMIYTRIDTISDDELKKSIEVIKKYF